MKVLKKFWTYCCDWRVCRTTILVVATVFVTDQLAYHAAMTTASAKFDQINELDAHTRALMLLTSNLIESRDRQ